MSPDASIQGQSERSDAIGSPTLDRKEIQFAYSENLPALLNQVRSSLLISTYRTGNLVVLSAPRGQLTVSFHTFERPMGMAVDAGGLAVGTRTQVWRLRNAPDIAVKMEPRGLYDACFLTRYSHFTGDIQCHELAWVSATRDSRESGAVENRGPSELWIVNTLFSCLCTVHPSYHFAPRWRPRFVSALAPEDRCHLNGLAVAEGKPRFVTALAETDSPHGWRPHKVGGGCVIDVDSGETLARGLTMPHSPRLAGNRLLVLDSGRGRLVSVDVGCGRVDSVVELPGYARGLALHGSYAFAGLSKVRATSSLDGVPIAAHPERLKCGCAVVDWATGTVIGHFEFVSGIDELFDVQVLTGVSSPYIAGPLADRDLVPPLWTVPPSR